MHELHSDHLGTPRVITTASGGTGVIEGRQNFGPYGELFPAMNSGYAPLTGYTGHIQTDPTGLIYMRGRFYTPIWHRFVNSDQGADPSTFNQMAYVGGSPMMAADPSGMVALQPTIIVTGHVDPIDEYLNALGGGGDGFWDASYGGPLFFMPVTIPKGSGGGLPQTPQQKADCIQKAMKAAQQQANAAKSEFDQTVNHSMWDIYLEGFNNNIVSSTQTTIASGLLSAGSSFLSAWGQQAAQKILTLPTARGGVTRWVPAPTRIAAAGNSFSSYTAVISAFALSGQNASGMANLYGYGKYAIPEAQGELTHKLDSILANLKSELGKCR